jgi:D-3-phosphoglycerate dehydrogenase / 2-oxoglutarate reductase
MLGNIRPSGQSNALGMMSDPSRSDSRLVLVTATYFDDASLEYLESNNCRVRTSGLGPGVPDTTLSKPRLFDLLTDAQGWLVATAPVTLEMLANFPELQVIAKRGVGYDQIDVGAAEKLGRVVTIAPGGNEPSVGDHTIALMLAVAKRICEFRDRMRAGDWSLQPVTELYQKTVGIVGLGRIGRIVVQRLKGFETKILAFEEKPDRGYANDQGVQLVDLATLLKKSDYVSLHLPLTDTSRNLIDAAALATMKKNAILINTSRGGLVDESALLRALRAGELAGAGLDVLLGEGNPDARPVAEQLMSLPNVVVTPHAAGASREGLSRANLIASKAIVAVLNGGSPAPGCLVVDGRQVRG